MKRILIAALLAMTFCCMSPSVAIAVEPDGKKTEKEVKKVFVKVLTTDEFKKCIMDFEKNPSSWVYKGQRPAIIDFYADWCGPCKAMAPVFKELAQKYDGKVDFYKVNVDDEKELAALFGIRSIPSLLFIPMEGKPLMHLGAVGIAELENAIINTLLPPDEE